VAPSPLRDRLEETFRFDASDLDANRALQLSPRQAARFRASQSAARVALAAFAAVMIGVAWLLTRGMGTEQRILIASAVGTAGVVGVLASASSLRALGRRTVSIAEGIAETDGSRLVLGATKLSLATPVFLEAFEPGAAYRLYYVAGPRALVLSAEALDERSEPGARPSPVDPAEDEVVRTAQRARVLVVALVVVAVDAPLLILLARDLPDGPRLGLYALVVLECVGFALFARWWLRRR
jgi:hypothetical protein